MSNACRARSTCTVALSHVEARPRPRGEFILGDTKQSFEKRYVRFARGDLRRGALREDVEPRYRRGDLRVGHVEGADHRRLSRKRESNVCRLYFIIAIVVVALLILYGIYAVLTSGRQTTDDAQVAADVVPVAARVAGQVVNVYIHENLFVHRGDPIADIDPSDAEVKVAQAQAADADARVAVARATAKGGYVAARAAVARAEAKARRAALEYERAQELGGKGDISRAQVDAARAANETAQAELAQARAGLAAAEDQRKAAVANIQQA